MSITLLQIYWIFLPLAVILLLVIAHYIVRVRSRKASGHTISTGHSAEGEIKLSGISLLYMLESQPGETICIELKSLTPYFTVKYDLIDEQGQVWAEGTHRYGQPENKDFAQLPTAGEFTFQIQSADQTTGRYSLSIDGSPES